MARQPQPQASRVVPIAHGLGLGALVVRFRQLCLRFRPCRQRQTCGGDNEFASMVVEPKLSLSELTRVIELFNHRNGTTRTGQYRVQANTED